MANTLQLEVVTPRREVLSEAVNGAVFPGLLGEAEVLPNHRPFLTMLRPGRLVVHYEGDDVIYYLGGGFAEILADRITILADACELVDDIDANEAKQRLQEALAAQAEVRNSPEEERVDEDLAVERAAMRLLLSGIGHKA